MYTLITSTALFRVVAKIVLSVNILPALYWTLKNSYPIGSLIIQLVKYVFMMLDCAPKNVINIKSN